MHRKYSGDGVVCMSVSVDPADRRAAALKFLQQQGATFPNYWMDEDFAVSADKFKIAGPPAVFVFGRDGKLAQRFESGDPGYEYTDVEKFVKDLIKPVK